ncbi:ATP-binding protein [candidate division WOR-3 bacterium]|nr:ATP-binding protein [candidate division WOR-3 bacterium]
MKEREFSFNNFAIGKANQLAFLSVKRTLKNLGGEINPLFIYAKKGLGKTHLMHSVKEILRDENVLYVDCATFTSIPEEDSTVFILENIHLIPDEVKRSIDLYRFVNSLISAKKQVYITSLFPPEELGISEQLIVLVKEGLTVPIFRPEPELVARIFKMLSSDYKIPLRDDVILFLSGLPFNDVREIETVLKKLDLLKDITNEITIEQVRDNIALEEIVPAEKETIPPTDSEFFNFLKGLKEDFEEGKSSSKAMNAIKDEYMQKLYIWKMKGFNVRMLEKSMDGSIDGIIQAFVSFTSNVQQLFELQKIFGTIENITTPEEKEYFEKNLFDPEAIFDLTRKLKKIEKRKKIKEEYNRFLDRRKTRSNFVILPSNRRAFGILRNVLEEKQKVDFPVYIYGGAGYGKTHLLIAFTKKMQELFGEKIISYIPSKVLVNEINEISGDDEREMLIEKFKGTSAIFLDDIEDIANDRKSNSVFISILNIFGKEKKPIVISSRMPPGDLSLEAQFEEFFLSGTVIPITKLKDEDRKVIITNLFIQKKISLSDKIKEFLSENLTGNFINIKRNVAQIIKKVVEENLEFTIDSISGCIEIKTPLSVEEKSGEPEEQNQSKDVFPKSKGEKILLSELDQKWLFLNERIFEEYNIP